jgi:acetyl-CoA carboxylase carboxyl transferase subunit beta
MLGDAHLAEPGAVVGFTGRRVILPTLRQTPPPDYQTAEFLEGRGMVDQVIERKDLPNVLGSMLATHMMGRDRRTAA